MIFTFKSTNEQNPFFFSVCHFCCTKTCKKCRSHFFFHWCVSQQCCSRCNCCAFRATYHHKLWHILLTCIDMSVCYVCSWPDPTLPISVSATVMSGTTNIINKIQIKKQKQKILGYFLTFQKYKQKHTEEHRSSMHLFNKINIKLQAARWCNG